MLSIMLNRWDKYVYSTHIVQTTFSISICSMVLDAAYSIHDRVFFDNLGQILLHAIVVSLWHHKLNRMRYNIIPSSIYIAVSDYFLEDLPPVIRYPDISDMLWVCHYTTNASLISLFFMVTLDQGQWPRVMFTKGNAPGSKWHLARSYPTYTPTQKKGNFRKVAFLLGKSVLLELKKYKPKDNKL